MKADERFVTFLNRRTFNGHTVDRIWAIEHDDVHASPLTRTHAEIKRPNESVVARADVLKVDNQSVETGEHFRRGLAMLTVQTVNRNFQPRMLVTFPFDHVVLGLAEKSVLRTEESTEFKQFSTQSLENLRRVFER